jgi:glycosidase
MEFVPQPWVAHTNVYEVNLRQYTREGNFAAFRKHLPRLKDMGVHTLWFMPITPISKARRKGSLGSYYAAASYVQVNPEFGTLQDFRSLVSEAQGMGMKVIIDWVANHTGGDHEWTRTHPDFYLRNEQGEFYDTHGWDDVIDLDYSNQEMRQQMIRSMEFWIRECGIDGFRCDMAMLVPVEFWRQARRALDSIRPLFWLAECDQWNDPDYLEVFDAAYTWKWMHAARDYFQLGHPMHMLKDVLFGYNGLKPRNAVRLWFTSNHDENSWNGTEYEKYGPMAIPLAVFSCTWNGMPLIYSGQELPNEKRLLFFDKDEIHWQPSCRLHDLYQKLLALKMEHPALRAGTDEVITRFINTDHEDKMLCYGRQSGDREVLVFLNLSQWPLDVTVYEDLRLEEYESLFGPRDMKIEAWGQRVYYR